MASNKTQGHFWHHFAMSCNWFSFMFYLMHKDILAAVVWRDKSPSLGYVKPLAFALLKCNCWNKIGTITVIHNTHNKYDDKQCNLCPNPSKGYLKCISSSCLNSAQSTLITATCFTYRQCEASQLHSKDSAILQIFQIPLFARVRIYPFPTLRNTPFSDS